MGMMGVTSRATVSYASQALLWHCPGVSRQMRTEHGVSEHRVGARRIMEASVAANCRRKHRQSAEDAVEFPADCADYRSASSREALFTA